MLITGRSNTKGAVRAYEAGADDVIRKPFDFEILLARLARRIEWASAMRQLREDNAALDARVVERAIQIGELRDRLMQEDSRPIGTRLG
jgi:PleD family two-component response regulator